MASQDNARRKWATATAAGLLLSIPGAAELRAEPPVDSGPPPKKAEDTRTRDEVRAIRADLDKQLSEGYTKTPKEKIDKLIKDLADDDFDTRLAATEELEKVGYYAREELGKATGSNDPEVAYRANLVLKKLRKIDNKTVEALLPSLARLGKAGSASKEAMPDLGWLLAKDDAKLRTAVLKTLGDIGPEAKALVPQLLNILKTDADVDASIEILSTLGRIGPGAREAVRDIEDLLTSDDVQMREKAAETLGNIGPDATSSSEKLGNIVAYSEDDPKVRLAAAKAIGKMGPKAENNAFILATALKNDSDPDIRAACAASIGQLGPDAAANVLPDLIEVLKSKDADTGTRIATAATIGVIGADAKDAKEALKAVAEDKDTDKTLKEACKRATTALEAKEKKR